MLDKRYRVNQSFEVLLYETETGSCFKYKMHNKVGSGRAYDMINANNAEALLSKVCTGLHAPNYTVLMQKPMAVLQNI